MEIAESIYEGVVTHPLIKKLPGKKSTILYSVGIREKKLPCKTLNMQRIIALESAVNDMYIT